jgi:hypothetical protein
MLELQGNRIRARKAKFRHRVRWIAALATVPAAAACVFALLLSSHRVPGSISHEFHIALKGSPNHDSHRVIGILNFQSGATARGLDQENAHEQKASSFKGDLLIVLPNGSESGDYVLRVQRASHIDEPVAIYTGRAVTGASGTTILRASVDFSSLPKGLYIAAWQRSGSASWDYGPFTIH